MSALNAFLAGAFVALAGVWFYGLWLLRRHDERETKQSGHSILQLAISLVIAFCFAGGIFIGVFGATH
jgi:TRAP-type C4-dicarboxylate transport system permease large subunit